MSMCPNCMMGDIKRRDGTMYGVCPDCGAFELMYEPQDYQMKLHKDPHLIRGIFGGFGSGKTTMAVAEIVDHCLSIPNGCTLITANTIKQLKKTAMKEFFAQMPEELITDFNKQENVVTLYNGHEVLFYPSDDDTKIRSLNLTAFYIEEASGIKYQIFVELQNRLRNPAGLEYKVDHNGKPIMDKDGRPVILKNKLIGIVCSNPDVNWIRTNFLLESETITGYGAEGYYVEKPNKFFSSHIIASRQNKFLPADFIERNSVNKPDWWIQRYLFGSFDYSDGMVYPDFIKSVCEPFEIPKDWKRLSAVDFGLRDPTVMLMGAVDPYTGILYFYKEHYEAGQPVNYHAEKMNKLLEEVPRGMLLYQPVADPSGKRRSTSDLKSLYEHYQEYGIFFQPGDNRIDSGISKVYTYFRMNKIKVFSTCSNIIREGVAYKYKVPELAGEKNLGEKPIDKDNHAMDCMRYMIQLLPDDPASLLTQAYGSWGEYKKNSFKFPEALREDEEEQADWYYN